MAIDRYRRRHGFETIGDMATPRHLLVDPEHECDYHLVSRCVRRAFLCGVDELTGIDYSHRRIWLLDRMRQLAPCFAVDVYAYTVLSNHFHLVLRHDPLACRGWSDEEVALRWYEAFPPTEHGAIVEARKPELRELMLGDPTRVARARRSLGCMSAFMKHLKQPVARRANLEDGCTGHFFEQRFYSGALLTEEALVAAMAYVDLNPVRAKLAARIGEIRDTSIAERLQANRAEALADYLRPVLSGLDPQPEASGPSPGTAVSATTVGFLVDGVAAEFDLADARSGREPAPSPNDAADAHRGDSPAERSGPEAEPTPETEPGVPDASPDPAPGPADEPKRRPRRPRPHITLADYVELVRTMVEAEATPAADPPDKVRRWMARTKILHKRQRAFGTALALRNWIADRGLQLRETPLPA